MAMAGAGSYKVLRQCRGGGGRRGKCPNALDYMYFWHDRHSVTKAPPRLRRARRGRVSGLALRLMTSAILLAALSSIVFSAKADTDSLKIGVLVPLEGAFEPLGKDALRGYELALSEHEERAGERPIEAYVESTDGTPASAIAKARMLIDRGASILIGPLAGIEGIAIREFAKSVPEVTFINGASAAQDATLRAPAANFFRFNPDSMQWIAGLGRYAYEEKDIRTIISIAEDYSLPYTQLLGFMLDYCALGGQVLARHWVSTGAGDVARIAKAVVGMETDALFLALEPRAAESFLEAYAEAGGQAAIVAGATTLSGSLLRASRIRPLLTGAISALPISESDDNEAWAEFAERYRERYLDAGPAPSLFALSYYVNTKALLLALDEIDGDLGEGHEDLREALAELSFDTPFGGPVELDENRQAVTSTFVVEVVETSDGSLTQETVHTVPEVGQTLGLARDVFLALGPPSRANTRCFERALPEAEAQPTPSETEVAAVTPDDQPAPETEERAEVPRSPADTLRDQLLLTLQKDTAMTETGPAIVPCLSYRDAPAAIAWLKEAFGFTENMIVPGPDGTIAHAQLALGTGLIMVGSERDDELKLRIPCNLGGVTQSIYVVVEDADAHYARAVAAGAEIVRELEDTPYDSRDYSARDPEGHLWNFGTYRPSTHE